MFEDDGLGRRRGRLSRRALLAATGAAVVSARAAEVAFARTAFEQRFSRMRNRPGWGGYWFCPHDTLTFDVNAGHGRLHLPAGLDSSAPDQPVPVFLLDHESRDGTHELHFHVTEAHLRPGLLLHRRDAFHFVGVTVETDSLVLAVYKRSIREAIAHAPVGRLGLGDHVLRVVVSGRQLTAGLWRAGQKPRMQLTARLPSTPSGTPGVLVVGPPSGAPATLLVSRYRLSAPGGFRTTAPQATFLITGTPQAAAGEITVGVRAASDIPASIQFEWSHDQTFQTDVHRSQVHTPGPPFTARMELSLAEIQPVYWRARLASNRSGTPGVSAIQRYTPHIDGDRLVLAAASCAHLWNQPAYDGLHRLLDATSQPPAILIYQGDLGYAGNARFSCYRESPDFYGERFARTLADPHFTALRRTVPVGFTLDDHDYSELNNAPPSEIPPWTTPLWNEIHADPSGVGYFDFRFGDVHCMTLDGRRYADPIANPNTPQKTKLGHTQRDWLEALLAGTDASLVVVFSADIFASRSRSLDCFLFGWPDEYRRLMTGFMDLQLRGVRVVILSGDAHGLRIHHHPDPAGRQAADGLSVVEFVCSGLAPRSWSGPMAGDLTLDASRFVLGHRGLGMITVDPPAASNRAVSLRAISGQPTGPIDLFPPLRLAFAPEPDSPLSLTPPRRPPRDIQPAAE